MRSKKEIFLIGTLIVVVAVLHSAPAQIEQCNQSGFYCTASNKYKLCIDGSAPLYEGTCSTGTSCYMSCSIECSSNDCDGGRCNPAGYYCTDDTHFKTCLDGSSDPVGNIQECPPGSDTVCSMNCNSQNICTAKPCPVTCTATSRKPMPGNTTAYYLCEVDANGEVTVTTQVCPKGTEFSDDKSACTLITPKIHNCTVEGRFPNPANCSKYHICLAATDGGFTKYDYDCGAGSFFNPSTTRCNSNPNVCGSIPKLLMTPVTTVPVCLADDTRYEDPDSCSHYFICSWMDGELISFRHACPPDTIFNPHTAKCTGRDNYHCYDG